MRLLPAILGVLATAASASAETPNPERLPSCVSIEAADRIMAKHELRGLFIGNLEDRSELRLYLNPEDRSWTILMLPANRPGTACLVAVGGNGRPFLQETTQ